MTVHESEDPDQGTFGCL